MRIRCHLIVLAAMLLGPSAWAAEAPPPAAEVVQDQLKHESVGETVMPDARDWQLDPAIFTELKPFSAPEIAIELPADQQE
ncbi:MAG: hypothetical protein ACR2PZ_16955 [Pseudomonadales bacterium]